MTPPPLVRARWRVRSWVQDLPSALVITIKKIVDTFFRSASHQFTFYINMRLDAKLEKQGKGLRARAINI